MPSSKQESPTYTLVASFHFVGLTKIKEGLGLIHLGPLYQLPPREPPIFIVPRQRHEQQTHQLGTEKPRGSKKGEKDQQENRS
jgi:hypothetical protein